MLGAIAGDIIGSVHEGTFPGTRDFVLFPARATFTDDTVLTIAIADAILGGQPDYATALRHWGLRYPAAGYGHNFYRWLRTPDAGPYQSFGNGSAMRVSPVAWAFETTDEVLEHAARSASPSHDHPEGILGAQAVATAIHLARCGGDKSAIAGLIFGAFHYDRPQSLAGITAKGGVLVTCRSTVPAATLAFLESTDFEDALRNAVALGGDTDTTACITGAIAEAFYGGVPRDIADEVRRRLATPLLDVLDRFTERYARPRRHPASPRSRT